MGISFVCLRLLICGLDIIVPVARRPNGPGVLIGIFGAAWIMRSSLAQGFTSLDQIGFRSLRRTLIAVVLACIGRDAYAAIIVHNYLGMKGR
ncbi:MAG: hypothetical protein U0768_02830 [Anaerolineae bacterium]